MKREQEEILGNKSASIPHLIFGLSVLPVVLAVMYEEFALSAGALFLLILLFLSEYRFLYLHGQHKKFVAVNLSIIFLIFLILGFMSYCGMEDKLTVLVSSTPACFGAFYNLKFYSKS